MKIAGVLIASMLLPSVACSGQSYVGVSGMVNAGYMWTPALSSSLRSLVGGSVDFQKGYSIIGAEMNYRNGSSVIFISGYIGTQEATLNNSRLIEPFIWKAHGGFGWVVLKTKSLSIYPVFGSGIFESSLIYHNKTDPDLRTVTRSASIDVGIHSDYLIAQTSDEGGYFSATTVGIRVGFTKGLSARELQGFYVKVSFGGLAFLKHKHHSKL